jgi:tRNA C32,U32 (ribose-2'-O)-methylase TrmJ
VKETGMTQAEMEKCFKSDDSPINQQSQQEELTQYYRKILLTKEGMTPKDKENMTNIIQKLQQANQCTQENLQKLEKITYAKAYIKI